MNGTGWNWDKDQRTGGTARGLSIRAYQLIL
jgi:hypothetical protein